MKGLSASVLQLLRSRQTLLLLGVWCELLYALYFLRTFPLLRYYGGLTDLGNITQASPGGFIAFVGVFALLFLLLGLAWRQVYTLDDPATLWLVLGFGALFALTMTFVYPITSADIFDYVDQSIIMVQYHANPVFTPPSAFPNDPLMPLSSIWRTSGSPYGPLAIVFDAVPTLFVGRNLLANLILLKLLFSAMAIAEAYLVYEIARPIAPRHAVSGALLVAWNPFVIFDISANGHNDIIMMFFALLGILSVTRGELTLGPLLLAASVFTKYATAPLFPLFLVYGFTRQPTWGQRFVYLLTTAASVLALAVVVYKPFWQGMDTLRPFLSQNITYFTSFGSVLSNLDPGAITPDQATQIGRGLFVPIYLYALWLSSRSVVALLRACVLTMFFMIALVLVNVWFWYALWVVVVAMTLPGLAERISALLLAFGVEVAAAFFFFLWRWLGGLTAGMQVVSRVSYLVIFLPAALALFALSRWHGLPESRGLVPWRRPS